MELRQRQRPALKKNCTVSFLHFLTSVRLHPVVLFEFIFLGTISIDIYSASFQNCPKLFVAVVKQVYIVFYR